MASKKDKTGGMGKLSKKVAAEVDAELSEREAAILNRSSLEIEALRPKVSDKESFDKLVEAVNEATAHNESVGEFRNRIEALGKGVMAVAKKVAELV
jgi:hypothetical protein